MRFQQIINYICTKLKYFFNQTINVMKDFKKLLFMAAVCTAAFTFTSCDKDDDDDDNVDDAISQTIEINGVKYDKVLGLYHQWEGESEINMDIDTDFDGDDNVHGYGSFDSTLVGKTVDLTTDSLFNIAFNYMNGGYFAPNYKSGSLTIKKVSAGYHILLNSTQADDT